MPLTETERHVLELAGTPYRYEAVRVGHIREAFGWSEPRFHQVVNALIDRPEAEAEMPALVRRLRRLRDLRGAQRRGRAGIR